ncbi:hypothetical protein CANINC_003615 [Pichia inconspicua]|uniref:BRCT domain-containing protein n=1 Tax=Pichia inconspicua TaxID=52247 RepID=A0A4T0WZB5_9ASCO|nr:hypothetical protein CANINC_003615 [[Candida] inconspicua]
MAPNSTFWIEDLDLLIVKDTFPADTDFEKLKSQLKKVTKLDLDQIFNVIDNHTLQTFTVRQLNKFSHIIAESTDFPKFDDISKLCIPIVTKEWINSLAKQKAMVPVRSFSPDPRMILKSCTVACGMQCDDEDVIKTAVRIFGGTNTSELRKSLTHFITDDPKHKSVMLIEEYNKVNREGLNVKIVRPAWLIDSIVNSKCMNENDYTLDKPATSNFVLPQFMQDLNIVYSQRLNLSKEMKKLLDKFLTGKGSRRICIEKFLDPTVSSEIPVRTFDYMFTLLLYKAERLNFDSLLFYPVREIPVLGMHRLVVATTNYTGDSRLYIEELLQRMGGFFTKTLKPSNTHLVASKCIGKKVSYAKKWNVNIVNHCWVEDCFVNWKILPDTNYHKLLKDDDSVRLINTLEFHGFDYNIHGDGTKNSSDIDSTSISETSLSVSQKSNQLKNSTLTTSKTHSNKSKEDDKFDATYSSKVSDKPELNQNESKENQNPLTKASSLHRLRNVDLKTDTSLTDQIWKIPDDDEKVDSSSQSSTTKALNLESSSKTNETDTLDISEKKTGSGLPSASAAPTSSKRSASNSSSHLEPVNKAAKIAGKPYNITAIVTGFNGTLSNVDKRELKKVGITIIDSPNKNLNCIIAPSLLRTQKFLTALAYDPEYFLEPLFLTDVLGTLDSVKKIGDFKSLAPKLEKYNIWAHVEFEKDIKPKRLFNSNVTKEEAIELLRKTRTNLLQKYSFNISSNLPAGFDTLKSILKSFGCKNCNNFTEKSKSVLSNMATVVEGAADDFALLICGVDETNVLSHFSHVCKDKNLGYIALDWNTVVTSIFQGEMKLAKNSVIAHYGITFS